MIRVSREDRIGEREVVRACGFRCALHHALVGVWFWNVECFRISLEKWFAVAVEYNSTIGVLGVEFHSILLSVDISADFDT